ncbi:hypothetical protein [Azospirillum doebereinerae]|uniref:Uncharacterized protein n=1 Tax=Azospirillum doebereinerae TaxID=92933 RepID=A0A3S0V7K9_9PROT|nr:hypothetical protein [Azospirillum doebereinerae]RUQ73788.1 hypothetical protein EJ913_09025 [Azospirillum doebereinerae]
MAEAFSVYNYEHNTVASVIAETTGLSLPTILGTAQFLFMMKRLEDVGAHTLVVERNYVDRDYLSDYTHFHARSFQPYDRFCTRLHFFHRPLAPSFFQSIVTGLTTDAASIDGLRDSYLGFMIVRPLPGKFIGRTCLKTPIDEDWTTPLLQSYSARLFGINLSVGGTVAFQEQDSIVAACATCAVWFALNAHGDHHLIPSPGNITRRAAPDQGGAQRMFPNRGLDMDMIVRALKREQYEVVVQDFRPLPGDTALGEGDGICEAKRTIYAYLRGGVAAPIMGVYLCEDVAGGEEDGEAAGFARHAITVLGYRFDESRGGLPPADASGGLRMRADAITHFLVHDDRVGPFCAMAIRKKPGRVRIHGTPITTSAVLSYALEEFKGTKLNVGGHDPDTTVQVPGLVALATYHKIRVQLKDVIPYIEELGRYLFASGAEPIESLTPFFGVSGEHLVWDVYVADSTAVKSAVRDALTACDRFADRSDAQVRGNLSAEALRVMTAGWPRYVWRATAYGRETGKPLVDLVIDATDTIQVRSLLTPVFYDTTVLLTFKELLVPKEDISDPWWTYSRVSDLIDGLARHFLPPRMIPVIDADERYGHPHPPRWLKPHEMHSHMVYNQQNLPWTKERCFVLADQPDADAEPAGGMTPLSKRLKGFLDELRAENRVAIWLIDEYCNLVIGEDAPSDQDDAASPKLGHPTLIGGARARISGELRPPEGDGDAWVLTNASGRYSKLRLDRDRLMLEEAQKLVEKRCGSLLKAAFPIKADWREQHGSERIRTSRDAEIEIRDLLGDQRYDDHDRMNIVREWADIFVHGQSAPAAAASSVAMTSGLAALASAEREGPARALFLHMIDRLLHHWPGQAVEAQSLCPLIKDWIGRNGAGLSADGRCALASLCVALHNAGNGMAGELEIISDWTEELPNVLLTAIRNARRSAAPSTAPSPTAAPEQPARKRRFKFSAPRAGKVDGPAG